MKLVFCLLALFAATGASEAGSTSVKGYARSDGTYVQPHMRSTPNSTRFDNYSTKGNSNPYTGKTGTAPVFKPLTDYSKGWGK